MKLLGNKLIPEENKRLIEINNKGSMVANHYCPPTLYDSIYLGKQISTLEEASAIYTELSDYEYQVLLLDWSKEVEEEYEAQMNQEYEERLALEEKLKNRTIEYESLEEE